MVDTQLLPSGSSVKPKPAKLPPSSAFLVLLTTLSNLHAKPAFTFSQGVVEVVLELI